MGDGIIDPLSAVPMVASGDKAAQQVQQVGQQYAQQEGLQAQIIGLAKPGPEEIQQLQASAEYGGSAIAYLEFLAGKTPPTESERLAYQTYLSTPGSSGQSIEEWTVTTRMQNAFPSLPPEKQAKMQAAIAKVMERAKEYEEGSEEQQIKKGSQLGISFGASRGGLIGGIVGGTVGAAFIGASLLIPGVNIVTGTALVVGGAIAVFGGGIGAGIGAATQNEWAKDKAKEGIEYLKSSFLSQGLTSALKDLSTDPEFGEEVRMLQTQMVVFAYDHQIKIAKPEEKDEKAKAGVNWLITQEANRVSSKYGLPTKILEFLAKQTVEDAAEWVAKNVKGIPGIGNKVSGYAEEFLQDVRIMQASARLKRLANDPSTPVEFYTELWNEYTTTNSMGPMLDKLESQDMATSKGIGNKIATWFESIVMMINNAMDGVKSQFKFNSEYKAPTAPNLSISNSTNAESSVAATSAMVPPGLGSALVKNGVTPASSTSTGTLVPNYATAAVSSPSP